MQKFVLITYDMTELRDFMEQERQMKLVSFSLIFVKKTTLS